MEKHRTTEEKQKKTLRSIVRRWKGICVAQTANEEIIFIAKNGLVHFSRNDVIYGLDLFTTAFES